MQFAVIFAPIMDFLKKNWQYIAFFWLAYILSRKLIGPSSSFLDSTPANESKATIGWDDAASYANALFVAFDGFGTDEPEVDRVFIGINNNIDNLRMVYKCFGTKEYGTFGSPLWGTGTPSSLRTWVLKELSGSSREKWLTLFAAAGIQS